MPSDDEQDNDYTALELLITEQGLLGRTIKNTVTNLKKKGVAKLTPGLLQGRLKSLNVIWASYRTAHAKARLLTSIAERAKLVYFAEDHYALTEESYEEAIDYINDLLQAERASAAAPQVQAASGAATGPPTAAIKLPKIELPTFSGSYTDWTNFKDLFESLVVNNTSLSKVQKLQYLKVSLSGEASSFLKNVAVTSANYESAWKDLKARYENTRAIINSYLRVLFNVSPVGQNALTGLKGLRDTAIEVTTALTNLERPVAQWGDLLVFLLVQKFDKFTLKEWETALGDSNEYPDFKRLKAFLDIKIKTLEAIACAQTSSDNKSSNDKVKVHHSNGSQEKPKAKNCPQCQADHRIYHCDKFKSLSVGQREASARKNQLCQNCLAKGHSVKDCTSKYTCFHCKQKHHALLHVFASNTHNNTSTEVPRQDNKPPVTASVTNESVSTVTAAQPNSYAHSAALTSYKPILLATARVMLRSSVGRSTVVRALLDQGSESSFISESVAQLLRLPRQRVMTQISGLGGNFNGTVTKSATFELEPCDGKGPVISTNALVLRKITSYVPKEYAPAPHLTHLRDLELADSFPDSEHIDLLIGADIYGSILLEGLRRGPPGTPIAQQTIFGWVLSGPMSQRPNHTHSLHVMHAITPSLDQRLESFWKQEEIIDKPHFTDEELSCQQHFTETHTRTGKITGQYVVRLPRKPESGVKLGESRSIALASLSRLEKRFERHPELRLPYQEFLSEYLALGHMQLISSAEANDPSYVYLPHHPVIKEESLTTKLRVVFNGSSPTTSGQSLNNTLLVGPKLQNDLPSIIMRWREHEFVYCADITKMFRQILVDPRDQHLQCILWRTEPNEPVQAFKLTTVTYGTASAPFLANRVIQQLAVDEANNFPLASPILLNDTYVDDVLFGASDRDMARQKRIQVTRTLDSGGFNLRKWVSNCPQLHEEIPVSDRCTSSAALFDESEDIKILGLIWLPSEDTFRFKIKLDETVPKTKRQVLSLIAKLYDPLGWLAPAIIRAKIILQALWLHKTGWDDELPPELRDQWLAFHELLPTLRSVSIPRWTSQGPESLVELHGFSDASNSAFAAVVYLRVTTASGEVTVNLLLAKTKVAPLKTLSIPRLELCAAALLAKTIAYGLKAMNVVPAALFCWTDSTVTLGWLRKHPSSWKTFVANRVSDIQVRLPSAIWSHVPSKDNPADCASRGVNAAELRDHSLWGTGPSWLRLKPAEWPKQKLSPSSELNLELKTKTNTLLACQEPGWDLKYQVSSWSRLLRITALVIRFTQILRRKRVRPETRAVTVDEIRQASEWWIKSIQAEEFRSEIRELNAGNQVSKESLIFKLAPSVDHSGIIRLGGRLRHSSLPESEKFPIILPKGRIAQLIIEQIHLDALHGGTQLTLRVLRERFWVLGARRLTKAIINKCVRCARERAQTLEQFMGDLPAARSSPSRPFTHTGLDYACPFNIRVGSGRGQKSHKAYIALFVCLSTRAIHVELVRDYTTESFLAALDRFVSRRGLPSNIYCDNGANFQGACRELATNFRLVTQHPDLQSRCATDGISWNFSPPSAPHFGGIWEAGVKSVKHHLRRMLGTLTPTSQEFNTLLCRIEACLNSRPIAPLCDDPESFDALTPGHFLIGTSMKAVPTPSLLDVNENRLSRWQVMQRVCEHFWQAWYHDYLHSLQQRQKWAGLNATVKVGDLVLLKNNNLPPAKWELGRIKQCFLGRDNLVRIVLVKTARTELTRPITQLCI